ncbi:MULTISPECIES: inorganic phosphate transporter [unclassified Acinetobacter]|uniref:inorganic phosphate transporter n=1 Tax=unclassified Acinetobacter TaxID=196816 RepID=UPI0035B770D2
MSDSDKDILSHLSQDAAQSTNVHQKLPKYFLPVFLSVIIGTLIYIGVQLSADLSHVPPLHLYSVILLGVALFIALGFEFVNGFHDTANAVATVIYTNALPAPTAVMWAGFCNFLGVMVASGAVAYSIIALLPVEMIMNVGSGAGFAMVFALLLAAIIWNLGTWFFGIPASSSHTLIGSIIGVGLMNQLLNAGSGTSGVDVDQIIKVGKALLFSPLIGFFFAMVVFTLVKVIFKKQMELFQPPVGNRPPPPLIRGILIFTCTGVSFAHGSNDGQKGMGLIMLILIGLVPLAYSLNKTLDEKHLQSFQSLSQQTAVILHDKNPNVNISYEQARKDVTTYIQTKELTATTVPALASLTAHLGQDMGGRNNLHGLDEQKTNQIRNDMYISMTALKALEKKNALPEMTAEQEKVVKDYRKNMDSFLQYIPTWVKVAVALALGLGTMVGWKRIVVTVGERIGKNHMTYGQGMSTELVAMTTIAAADGFGMPVSTTHVLNSAVAGTMVANKSGLQASTIKTILSAWVLTLPVTIALSGGLFWLFLQFVK